jgi:UDP-2,3-diacylglucosamine pyrophosphatase LpxH
VIIEPGKLPRKLVMKAAAIVKLDKLRCARGAQSKFAAEVVDRYEHALAAEARRQGTDGVICGHIHCPRIRTINGILYVNDGDWVRTPTLNPNFVRQGDFPQLVSDTSRQI